MEDSIIHKFLYSTGLISNCHVSTGEMSSNADPEQEAKEFKEIL